MGHVNKRVCLRPVSPTGAFHMVAWFHYLSQATSTGYQQIKAVSVMMVISSQNTHVGLYLFGYGGLKDSRYILHVSNEPSACMGVVCTVCVRLCVCHVTCPIVVPFRMLAAPSLQGSKGLWLFSKTLKREGSHTVSSSSRIEQSYCVSPQQ